MHSRKSYWLVPILVLSFVLFLTASIPDVSTGTWQTWNNMGDVRSGAAAVLLQDGRVFIIGGTNANGPVASADIFGTDGNFSAAAAMQTPRSGHTATVLSDGRVLVTGGTTSGGGAVNTAEIYDPSANSWSAPATTVDARAGHTASLLSDGRVLLAGGHDSAGNALSGLEIFDPASGKFSSAGAMSVPRMNHAAATLSDGRVLIIGGTADGTTALASIDIYDPIAGTVSAGPALSTPRISATATTTLDGKVAVIGGNNGSAAGSQDLASAEIFDPATGQLSPSASSLVTARSGHQAFLLPKNNAILVLGGSSAGTDLNSAELYYSWADSFHSTGAMSVARPGLTGSALSLDGRFLAAGGTGLASTELYGFATVKTDAADYPPGSTVTITGSGWQPGETVTLTLLESPLIDTPPAMTAVADGNGNISNNQFSPDSYDVNVRFYLTAVGQTSAFQAQNTFTDSKTVTVAFASTGSGSVTSNPAGITCTDTGGIASGTCTVSVGNTAQVTLTATATSPSTIGAWTVPSGYTVNSGCVSGNTTCTFTLNNSPQTVTVAFNPGPAAKYLVTSSNYNPVAGTAVTITAQLADSGNNPVATSGKVVTWSKTGSGGSFGSATSTTNASGVATVSFTTGTVAGTVYTVTATDNTSLTGTSANITTVAGALDHILFGQQPTNTQAGSTISPAVTVLEYDVNGNVLTADNSTHITISIGTNPPGTGVLSGSTNVVVSGGIATFSNLSINVPGDGYTLTAHAPSNLTVTSTPFNITPVCTASSVTTQPTNQTVTYGSNATFTAAASGDPGPTVQWQLSTNFGASFSDILGATSTTLTVNQPPVNASGNQYHAVFTNTCGGTQTATSNAATLTVSKATASFSGLSAPTITFGDSPISLGGTIKFGSLIPTGVVHINVNSVTHDAAINSSTGAFSFSFDTSAFNANTSGYVITYTYDGDSNFNNISDAANNLIVNKASSTTVVTVAGGVSFTYDGLAHPATVSVTGVGGLNLSPAPVYSCGHVPIDVADSGCTASYNFTGDANHTGSSDSKSYTISKAPSVTTVTVTGGESFQYDGLAHPATVSVTGVGGLNLSPAPVYSCGHVPIDVADSGCTASYTFAGDGNHNSSSDSKTYTIAKANSTTTVTVAGGETFTYDGNSHPATVSVTGVGGLNLNPAPVYSCGHVPVNVSDSGCTASYTFAGDGNHNGSFDSKTYTITKAISTTTVSGGGSFVFDGLVHGATVSVTGAGGLSLTPSPTYSCGVSAPTHVADTPCTASYTYAGDDNHFGSNGSATMTITKAPSTTTVSGGGSFVFDGLAHGASVSVTGVGGLNLTPTPNYTGACSVAPVHVADTPCTASYTYAGDGDHFGSNDSVTITITKAPSTTTVSGGGSFVFDGNPHGASVSVTGVGGLNLTPAPNYTGACSVAPVHVADTPCTASYTYAGDGDHFGSNDSVTITITKAPSTTTVSGGGSFVFDGNPHGATVLVTGVGGLNLTPAPTYSGACSAAPVHVADTPCTASYTFAGDSDHFGSNNSVTITITRAPSTTTVSGGGSFVFDGSPHAATVSVTGAGNLSLTPAPSYSCGSAPVHVPQTPCTASYTFAGDDDHFGSSESTTITITKAPSTTTVSGGGSFVFDGSPHAATVSVTGAGNLSLTPAPSYSCGSAPVHVADTPCTASYTFAGDGDHDGSNGSAIITITKAPSTTTIGAGFNVVYDGSSHGVAASVTGAGGLNQPVPVSYNPGGSTVPVNPGTYTATATFAGDPDHFGSSAGPVTINITFGACGPAIGPSDVILPPINSDGTSVYNRKGGSTIPVKFNVCGANGAPLTDPTLVFAPTGGALTMTGAMRGTITVVNETGTNDIPDAAFTWDGQQWHFNMATMNLSSGYTYTFRINLAYAPASIQFMVGVK